MPNGGQLSAGSGIRLQSSFPGVQDSGNENITGTVTASFGNFPGQANIRALTGDTDPGGTVNVAIGDSQSWTFGGGNRIISCIAIGPLAHIFQRSVNQLQGAIAIGGNAEASENNCIAIGSNTVIGGATTNGAFGGIAIGSSAQITNRSGQTYNVGIVIGQSSSQLHGVGATNPKHGITIGNSINETTNTGNFLGGNIIITLIGNTITNSANMIVIDTQSDTGGSGRSYTATDTNAIVIGNVNHTKVTIAGKDFTNLGGSATRSVNDVDATATSADGTIQYSAITAARVVNLPAANAVPAGFRLMVVDFSGNASGVNTITLTRAGADTINGVTTAVINSAYGVRELQSNGATKWTVIRSI